MDQHLVDNLKKLCNEHEIQARTIRDRIREIEDIPKAKALVGKCYKYLNSYGFKTRRWWSYKRVISYSKVNIYVDSFHQDAKGEVEIKYAEIDSSTYFSNRAWTEITEKEYFAAYKRLVNKIIKNSKKGE